MDRPQPRHRGPRTRHLADPHLRLKRSLAFDTALARRYEALLAAQQMPAPTRSRMPHDNDRSIRALDGRLHRASGLDCRDRERPDSAGTGTVEIVVHGAANDLRFRHVLGSGVCLKLLA